MQKNKLGLIVSFALLAVPAAWGAANNCGTGGSATTNNTTVITLANANNENSTGGGCTDVDATFNNFAVPASSNSQTTSTTDVLGTVVTGGFTTPSDVQVQFSPVTASSWECVGTTCTTTETIEFTEVLSDPGDAIYEVSGALNTTNDNHTSTTITVDSTVCNGSLTYGCGTPLATLDMSVHDASGSPLTSTFGPTAFGSKSTTISIESQITISESAGDSDHDPTLNYFYLDFSDESTTPEPSTFILLGSALGGLGLLRLRRKKA